MAQEPVKLTDRSVHSIGDSLREFGYTVTDEECRTTAAALLAGSKPDSDIIAMFISRMLREAGLLPDES